MNQEKTAKFKTLREIRTHTCHREGEADVVITEHVPPHPHLPISHHCCGAVTRQTPSCLSNLVLLCRSDGRPRLGTLHLRHETDDFITRPPHGVSSSALSSPLCLSPRPAHSALIGRPEAALFGSAAAVAPLLPFSAQWPSNKQWERETMGPFKICFVTGQ